MTSHIVVLGGGTGGTLAANRLRRMYPAGEAEITVVDQDDRHVYQPGLLFVPFGLAHPEDIVRPRGRQLRPGIAYRQSAIDHVDVESCAVQLDDGGTLHYDVLIVATGAVLVPEETEGLTGPGWMEKVFTFYTPEGAGALEGALATFDGGRLVPASKAGSVTHFEGEVLVENVRRHLAGEPLVEGFDGHANCFIETGFHKALLIDFNYDTEPLPSHFPGPVGLPLLKESRLNHLGKLMFQWFYWHSLLPGRDIPGIGADMPTAGKHLDASTE